MRADIDPVLLEDAFWASAFDSREPFRQEYVREFRRGVVDGGESDLAWARMAIYGIADAALWPIVKRLVFLGTKLPASDFVESLSFFLSIAGTLSRLDRILSASQQADLGTAVSDLRDLQAKLNQRQDRDLAERLEAMCQLLSKRIGPTANS